LAVLVSRDRGCVDGDLRAKVAVEDQHGHWPHAQEEARHLVLTLPALRLFDGWATFALLLQLQLGDRDAVDFVGAVGEA
jgi:hypothetical protein